MTDQGQSGGGIVVVDPTIALQVAVLTERLDQTEKATKLQAEEYKRRLDALNHAHEKAVEVQHTYVTQDKYEDNLDAEREARVHALARIDEKFEEYVQRWELRQREIDQTITTLTAAAAEAKQIAETQGRQTRKEADDAERRNKEAQNEQARRQTRNITVMGIGLAAIVGLANILPNII